MNGASGGEKTKASHNLRGVRITFHANGCPKAQGPRALTCARIRLRVAMLRGFHAWQTYQRLVGFTFYWTVRNSERLPRPIVGASLETK